MADDLPVYLFATRPEFEAWLEDNHGGSPGIWLKIAKKGSGVESVDYAEALELALCFGWIDSQKRGLDESFFLQRFTPRRPRGKWSQINRTKAEELIAAGAMRAAGLAEVEAAKADGRWDATYAGRWTAALPLASSSIRSMPPTATRSSTGCKRRRNPRLASAGCTSSSP